MIRKCTLNGIYGRKDKWICGSTNKTKQMYCGCYMWRRGQITPILKLLEHDAKVQSAGPVRMRQDLCVWGLRWERRGCWECPEDTLNQKSQTAASGPVTCFCKWSCIRTQPHPFLTCCFWLLSAIMAELSGCNRDHMTTSLKYLLTGLYQKVCTHLPKVKGRRE